MTFPFAPPWSDAEGYDALTDELATSHSIARPHHFKSPREFLAAVGHPVAVPLPATDHESGESLLSSALSPARGFSSDGGSGD